MHRRKNLAALNNGNMIVTRPAPGAAVARPNDQAAAIGAIPDETELDFRDGKINRSSSTDSSINLDLTLGTPWEFEILKDLEDSGMLAQSMFFIFILSKLLN